ncbi:MAG: FmdB family zinc ribbon protein, partial [bacterium]
MATYEYSCADHGITEVDLPMGTAPQSVGCPECGEPAKRVYSSPMVSSVDQGRMKLIDSTKASADAPEVVSSVPRGGRGHGGRLAVD